MAEMKYTDTELIVNYLIPVGQENAVTLEELARAVGTDKRCVRDAISQLRREFVILNMQDGNGYFKPSPDEIELTKRWVKQEESRMKKLALSLRAGRKAVKSA